MASRHRVSLVGTVIQLCLFSLRVQLIFVSSLIKKVVGLEDSKKEQAKVEYSDVMNKVMKAENISEMAEAHGYVIREHVVNTKDGYVLVIHKLDRPGRNLGNNSNNNKIAYFHHGLLTNSELFFCGSKREKNLPFLLFELGYEVWLGNNRGNKYSRKHVKMKVSESEFWDFSLDEFALYDIPNTIDYIRSFYDASASFTYIGFSQGCAQLLASLGLNPGLNTKITMFVGLSPAVIPRNWKHSLGRVIVDYSANDNNFLYSVFGSKAILPSISFWSYLLGTEGYRKVVDKSLVYLFGWSGSNIGPEQKIVGYPHMFSNSSVKCLMHWFQIIHAQRFQMFDETGSFGRTGISNLSSMAKKKAHHVAPFPISHHLDVPMFLVYGDNDVLVDIDRITKLILDQNEKMKNNFFEVLNCPGYEHMDTLWGDNVYNDVFKKIIDVVEAFNNSYLPEYQTESRKDG